VRSGTVTRAKAVSLRNSTESALLVSPVHELVHDMFSVAHGRSMRCSTLAQCQCNSCPPPPLPIASTIPARSASCQFAPQTALRVRDFHEV